MSIKFRFGILTLGFALAYGVYVPVAQASLLEFLFPGMRANNEEPAKTLEAPFAKVEPEIQSENIQNIPDYEVKSEDGVVVPDKAIELDIEQNLNGDDVALNLPHRTNKDIGTWAMMMVSDTMTYTGSIDKNALKENLKIFSATGAKQYLDFMSQQKILSTAQSNAYDVRAYVQSEPLLLNAGEVDGRYRWLFQVPVMVSYIQRGTSSYKGVEAVNRAYKMRVQIGRDPKAVSDIGVNIERWSGVYQKAEEPIDVKDASPFDAYEQ